LRARPAAMPRRRLARSGSSTPTGCIIADPMAGHTPARCPLPRAPRAAGNPETAALSSGAAASRFGCLGGTPRLLMVSGPVPSFATLRVHSPTHVCIGK
jgi:hypothetical protein